MGGLFSKAGKKKGTSSRNITEKDKAVLDLKHARDKSKKYKLKLEGESGKLLAQILELKRSGKTERALLSLKRKKLIEKGIETVENELIHVEEMIKSLEWAAQNVEIMKALEHGKNALNDLNNQMPIDKIEALLDESDEAIEMENQISKLLGNWGSNMSDIEESELESELEALMGVEKKATVATVPSQSIDTTLPIAPSTSPIILPDVPIREMGIETGIDNAQILST